MNILVIPKSEPEVSGLHSKDSITPGWDSHSLNLENLNQHIRPLLDSKWYDLGVELLEDDDDIAVLNELQCRYPSDNDICCTKMFQMWLEKRHVASWSHLIKSLRQPNVNLNELASKIALMIPLPDQTDTLVTTTSVDADFRNLLITVSTILDNSTNKESDLEKCKNYCSSLRISDNSDEPLFSSDYTSMICESTNFKELFRTLNWYLNWDEHSILTLLVAKCHSYKAQEEVENFDKKLVAVCDELDIASSTPEYSVPAEFQKFCIVINSYSENLAKSEYDEIKDFVFTQLDISHYLATRYIKVLFHSLYLELEWYVAKQAVPFMIKMAFQNAFFFIKEGFVFMQIGETIIFDNQEEKEQSSFNASKRNSFQRVRTQGLLTHEIPKNAVNIKLQKILKYRAKSCLQFFNQVNEESDENSNHSNSSSSNSSSRLSPLLENNEPSFDICNNINKDEANKDVYDDVLKRQNTGNSTHASVISGLDYVATKQNEESMSELLIKAFDNDDIEGIIPPRFLMTNPNAMLDNIRKEVISADSSSALSSRQSSIDGEASIPSYNAHVIRQIRRRVKVSIAPVTRISPHLCIRRSFSMDVNVSLTSRQGSTSESMDSSRLNSESLVNDNDESSSVSSQTSPRRRKFGMVRSRVSVLQWLANRTLSFTDSHRDSLCSLPEEKIFVCDSEASDVESYHSCSDDDVIAA